MTIDEIKKWMLESSGFPVTQANVEYLERFQAIAFQAGAASRDAYIEQLELALLQVRKAICGDIHNTDDLLDLIASRDSDIQRLQFALADSEALELGTAERCDQLRAQINVLREAATPFTSPDVVDETSGTIPLMDALEKALASTPEQSITEYRNNVIDECASVCDKRSMRKNDGNWTDFEWDSICGTNELAADEIRAMKEQP